MTVCSVYTVNITVYEGGLIGLSNEYINVLH